MLHSFSSHLLVRSFYTYLPVYEFFSKLRIILLPKGLCLAFFDLSSIRDRICSPYMYLLFGARVCSLKSVLIRTLFTRLQRYTSCWRVRTVGRVSGHSPTDAPRPLWS